MGYRRFSALLCAGTLCACKAVDKYHVPPVGIVSDTVPPEKILYGSGSRQHNARTVAEAYLNAYKIAYEADYTEDADRRDLDVKAAQMTRLGMTLIETRCDLFFQSIGRGSQKMDFIHREVEIVSSVLTATLGLTGAGDDLVAATGLANGFALSSLDNYGDVFFFSPDVGKVQRLVTDGQNALRTEMLAPAQVPRDFESAIRALKRYQTVCTAQEIRRLVNEAVDAGRIRVRYAEERPTTTDSSVQAMLDQIATLLKVPNVTLRDAALLSWLIRETPDAAKLDFICVVFSTKDLRDQACTGGLGTRKIGDAITANGVEITKRLDTIGLLKPKWIETELDNWKTTYEAGKGALEMARKDAATAKDAAARANAERDALQSANEMAAKAELKSQQPSPNAAPQPGVAVIKVE